MPSVRVKMGYANLDDPRQPAPNGRSRNRSFASVFAPPQTPGVRESHLSVDSETGLRTANVYHNEGKRMALPRAPPSRISQHLAANARPRPPANGGSQYDQSAFLSPTLSTRRGFPFAHHNDRGDMMSLHGQQEDVMVPRSAQEPGRIGSAFSLPQSDDENEDEDGRTDEDHHHDDIVEHLDVIDPQIATVSMLTNAANAIVIPPLSFYSRKPVIVLPRRRTKSAVGDQEKGQSGQIPEDELDEHVEELLRKRDKFRRVMRGVWSFVKTPLGAVTAIYGFLVVFWGTALVLFLVKWIDLHNANTQGLWVEVSQQIETSLFSVTSIGLMPFRIEDTYRIYKIWHYKRMTRMLRAKAGLPELYDEDDLPDPVYDANYVHVLTEEQQIDLHYQQHRFMESQTWYRPHGTQTHRAFPINIAITICVMNDLNSLFQCMLSACMWSMNRFDRPAWTDGTTLPAAFIVGILAGFYIYWGGRKTKRVKEVTERLRTALAMERPETAAVIAAQATRKEKVPGAPEVSEAEASSSADTSPTVASQEPRCKDYAAQGAIGDKRTHTAPAVHIAEEMTVPAVGELPQTQ